jgi:hypothetical protein
VIVQLLVEQTETRSIPNYGVESLWKFIENTKPRHYPDLSGSIFIIGVSTGISYPFIAQSLPHANIKGYSYKSWDSEVIYSTGKNPESHWELLVSHEAEAHQKKLGEIVFAFAKSRFRSTETLIDTTSFFSGNLNRVLGVSLKYDSSRNSYLEQQVVNLDSNSRQLAKAIVRRSWISDYPWLQEATKWAELGRYDLASRAVYKTFGNWLRHGDYKKCIELLMVARVDDLSEDILLSLLSVSLPYQANLPSRPEFFRKVSDRFQRLGLTDPTLLDGLG